MANRPQSQAMPDAARLSTADMTWLTFSGSPEESASDFIQSVQRVAFQQDRVNDDRWLTEYASTCFSNGSLHWYSELDEETRNSWSKLRVALLRQYSQPIPTPAASLPAPIPGDSSIPGTPAAGPVTHFALPPQSAPEMRRGHIEVFLQEYATTLGFIAYDTESATFLIVRTRGEAQVVTIPQDPGNVPVHINMEGLPDDDQYPYMGLMVKNNDQDAPHFIPPPLPSSLYGSRDSLMPSILCSRDTGRLPEDRPIATWTFKACTKSSTIQRHRRSASTSNPVERASAAIWKHDQQSNKLSIVWMMDNDKEGELRVIVPDNLAGNLHVHRLQDWNKARSRLREKEATLYFMPKE